MRISQSAILSNAREGRVTLQVPEFSIVIGDDGTFRPDHSGEREFPDEWFHYVKIETRGRRPCIGKEQGSLYLTREGFEANRELLREAFEQAIREGRTDKNWEDFETYVENYFDQMRDNIEREIDKYNNKINQLREHLQYI